MGTLGAVRFSTMHCIHCAKDLLPSFHPQSVSIFFRHPCVPSHRLLGLGHPTFAIHSRIQSPRKAHWRERGVRQCLSLFPPAPPFEREEKVPRAGSIHSVPLYSVLAGRGGGACIHCGTSLHKKTPNRESFKARSQRNEDENVSLVCPLRLRGSLMISRAEERRVRPYYREYT